MKPRMLFLILVAAFALRCNEALPVHTTPTNILSFKVSTIEQLTDRVAPPGKQAVRIVFTGENTFDEVFQDSIDIKGTVRIWWKRKPARFRTIELRESNFKERALVNNGKLLLLPGQKFTLETVWNVKSDDSLYLPSEMNFRFLRTRTCAVNIACADPEDFVVESSVNIYDRLGVVTAPPAEFTFIARTCVLCGAGPVCPPPAGGCGGAQEP